jgi:hypothetical protein
VKSRSRTKGWVRITFHAVWITLVLAAAVIVVQKSFPSSTQLNVSATILKKTWVRQGSFPQELLLSEADIRRGYMEVAAPTVLWVRNNSDDGFEVELDIEGDYVSEVRVRGLSNEFVVGRSGGAVVQRGHYPTDTRFDLRWRLQLAENARAGRYPWPVRIQVQAK